MPFLSPSDAPLFVAYPHCLSRGDLIDIHIPMTVLVLNSIVWTYRPEHD